MFIQTVPAAETPEKADGVQYLNIKEFGGKCQAESGKLPTTEWSLPL